MTLELNIKLCLFTRHGTRPTPRSRTGQVTLVETTLNHPRTFRDKVGRDPRQLPEIVETVGVAL